MYNKFNLQDSTPYEMVQECIKLTIENSGCLPPLEYTYLAPETFDYIKLVRQMYNIKFIDKDTFVLKGIKYRKASLDENK